MNLHPGNILDSSTHGNLSIVSAKFNCFESGEKIFNFVSEKNRSKHGSKEIPEEKMLQRKAHPKQVWYNASLNKKLDHNSIFNKNWLTRQ